MGYAIIRILLIASLLMRPLAGMGWGPCVSAAGAPSGPVACGCCLADSSAPPACPPASKAPAACSCDKGSEPVTPPASDVKNRGGEPLHAAGLPTLLLRPAVDRPARVGADPNLAALCPLGRSAQSLLCVWRT